LGLNDLPDDARFATNADRVANNAELAQILEDILITQPTAHWIEILSEQRIPVASVRNLQDVLAWEQIAAMNFLESLSSDSGETYTVVDPTFTVDGALKYRKPAPSLGQHTTEVLEELKISKSEIADLVSAGVVGVYSRV
jgi:crotonobetainyl-CoA:carnitine CoA-transferase CaiB-like acyl-CoA transferase